jgi:hypothetical protein
MSSPRVCIAADLLCPRCGGNRVNASVVGISEKLQTRRVRLRCDDCLMDLRVTVTGACDFGMAFKAAFARAEEGPVHGEERNRRFETLSSSTQTYVDAAGGEHTFLGSSHEADVSERFCETCNEWVECGSNGLGLLGHMICSKCNTEWDAT